MRGLKRASAYLVLVAVLLLGGRARADGKPSLKQLEAMLGQAHGHYRTGQALFESKRYREAIHEFDAGYKVSSRPAFLLNIAQCYKALGARGQARDYYRRFLVEAPPDDPPIHTERADVRLLLAQLEGQIRSSGLGTVVVDEPAAPRVVVQERIVTRVVTAPPQPTWYGSKVAWGFAGGGALLVIGGGVTLAASLSAVASANAAATRADWLAARSRATALQNTGIVLISVGAAALVAGVVVFIVAGRRASLPVGAWLSPTGGGLAAMGTF